MTSIDHERMSDVFQKFHLRGPWPFNAVLHHFSDIDHGDPHDHPWGFRSIVLAGGYVERVFARYGSYRVFRRPGDSFEIAATHIHRIEELPAGDCWTLILPGPHERTSRFWQFRDDGPWSRAWHDADWTRESEQTISPPDEDGPVLSRLLQEARAHGLGEDEIEAQRRSWMIGEIMLSNGDMDRVEAARLYDQVRMERSCA